MKQLLALAILLTPLVACEDTDAGNSDNVQEIGTVGDGGIIEYGSGVYYFDYINAAFGNQLAAFIHDHPELELVEMTVDTRDGGDSGYFVVFRPSEPCGRTSNLELGEDLHSP